MICYLLILILICWGKDVNVKMISSWGGNSLLSEACESYRGDFFSCEFKAALKMQHCIKMHNDKYCKTDKSMYEIASDILADDKIALLNLHSRRYHGLIKAHAQMFSEYDQLNSTTCNSPVIKVGNKWFCNFDGDSIESSTVIVYGVVGEEKTDKLLRKLTLKNIKPIFRHHPESLKEDRIPLQGYGVYLDVKNSEYNSKKLDDKNYLFQGADSDFYNLGMQIASASQKNFSALVDYSVNYPGKLAELVKNTKFSPSLTKAVHYIRYNYGIGSGYNELSIKGFDILVNNLDNNVNAEEIFSGKKASSNIAVIPPFFQNIHHIIPVIENNEILYDKVKKYLPEKTRRCLTSLSKEPVSKRLRINVPKEKIHWLKDIETNPDFDSLPQSFNFLISKAADARRQNQFIFLKKNMYNLVTIVDTKDLLDEKKMAIVSKLIEFGKDKSTPLRVGFVLINTGNDNFEVPIELKEFLGPVVEDTMLQRTRSFTPLIFLNGLPMDGSNLQESLIKTTFEEEENFLKLAREGVITDKISDIYTFMLNKFEAGSYYNAEIVKGEYVAVPGLIEKILDSGGKRISNPGPVTQVLQGKLSESIIQQYKNCHSGPCLQSSLVVDEIPNAVETVLITNGRSLKIDENFTEFENDILLAEEAKFVTQLYKCMNGRSNDVFSLASILHHTREEVLRDTLSRINSNEFSKISLKSRITDLFFSNIENNGLLKVNAEDPYFVAKKFKSNSWWLRKDIDLGAVANSIYDAVRPSLADVHEQLTIHLADNKHDVRHFIRAVVDPVTRDGQRILSILQVLHDSIDGLSITVLINPSTSLEANWGHESRVGNGFWGGPAVDKLIRHDQREYIRDVSKLLNLSSAKYKTLSGLLNNRYSKGTEQAVDAARASGISVYSAGSSISVNPNAHGRMPLSFYRHAFSGKFSFDEKGNILPAVATFSAEVVPASSITYTLGTDEPESWMVFLDKIEGGTPENPVDADNLHLDDCEEDIWAEYGLRHILLTGTCLTLNKDYIRESDSPPSLPLALLSPLVKNNTNSNNSYLPLADTVVMTHNFGYFQLKIPNGFGLYKIDMHLHIRNYSRDYDILKVQSVNYGTVFQRLDSEQLQQIAQSGPANDTLVLVSSFTGQFVNLFIAKTPSERIEEKELAVSQLRAAHSFTPKAHGTLNIFSLASGLLYERLLRLMMFGVATSSGANRSSQQEDKDNFYTVQTLVNADDATLMDFIEADYGMDTSVEELLAARTGTPIGAPDTVLGRDERITGKRLVQHLRAAVHLKRQIVAIPKKKKVKFWLVENFLSPDAKKRIRSFARDVLHADLELVSYKWPYFLRKQTDKQRTIWAYKVLFLDVLFPLDLRRIIFVDADQIVSSEKIFALARGDTPRGAAYSAGNTAVIEKDSSGSFSFHPFTDLHELYNLDIEGRGIAFTPFCGSRNEYHTALRKNKRRHMHKTQGSAYDKIGNSSESFTSLSDLLTDRLNAYDIRQNNNINEGTKGFRFWDAEGGTWKSQLQDQPIALHRGITVNTLLEQILIQLKKHEGISCTSEHCIVDRAEVEENMMSKLRRVVFSGGLSNSGRAAFKQKETTQLRRLGSELRRLQRLAVVAENTNSTHDGIGKEAKEFMHYLNRISSLRKQYYHISALFLVDFEPLRYVYSGGDVYRFFYNRLSADAGSLSNLDQDLPNFVQSVENKQRKIFQLLQDPMKLSAVSEAIASVIEQLLKLVDKKYILTGEREKIHFDKEQDIINVTHTIPLVDASFIGRREILPPSGDRDNTLGGVSLGIPIYSLPETFLYCSTWCSREMRSYIKTVDLCNNPLTKMKKTENANQVIFNWDRLDSIVQTEWEKLEK